MFKQKLSSFYSLLTNEITSWPNWWQSLSRRQKVQPLFLVILYLIVLIFFKTIRSDHFIICSLLLIMSYGGKFLRSLLNFILPLALTGIVYDSQRIWGHWIRGTIHVQEPYYFDKTFFGVQTPEGVLTPNEFLQKNTHPFLDLVTGFYYLAFFAIFQLQTAYYRFWASQTGTLKLTGNELKEGSHVKMWAFFLMNIGGYMTYYIYPAAPPWYVEQYGLGPVNLNALPSAAGAVRFDQLLGTNFFAEIYGRSAAVFGAIPSLHVAFPALAVYYSHRFGIARAFSWKFYVIMFFASVYLNHHYILDGLLGTLYAILAGLITDTCYHLYKTKKKNNHHEIPSITPA